MAFWGAEVIPGQTVPFVPPPEGHRLHLTQASLASWSVAGDQRAAVTCKTQDSNPLRICCLSEQGQLSHSLDLMFEHYTEFQAEGAAVHLAGYHMPVYEEGDDEEGLSPEEALRRQLGLSIAGNDQDDEYDSEEDEDYDMDSEDDGESDDEPGHPNVVIEDITDTGLLEAPPAGAGDALQANGAAHSGKGKRVRFSGGLADGSLAAAEAPAAVSAPEQLTPPSEPVAKSKAGSLFERINRAATAAAAASKDKASKKKRKANDAGSTPTTKLPASGAAGSAASAAAAETGVQAVQPTTKAAGKNASKAAPASAAAAEASLADAPDNKKQTTRRYDNGFEVENVSMGQPDGKLAKGGRKVTVKYTGRLLKGGKVFDQSKGKGFNFRLGVGDVIKGWDLGVSGMRVGDKRKLTIPPQLAYGSSGVKGAIPGNATLLFDVELVDVK